MKVISSDSLARLLEERLSAAGDPLRAVTLSQLLETHLSYPAVRTALGLAGKGEYDVAVLGLLVDRALLQVDPAVEAAAKRALESVEPGLDFAGALADRLVRIRRDSGDRPRSSGHRSASRSRVGEEPQRGNAAEPEATEGEASPTAGIPDPGSVPEPAEHSEPGPTGSGADEAATEASLPEGEEADAEESSPEPPFDGPAPTEASEPPEPPDEEPSESAEVVVAPVVEGMPAEQPEVAVSCWSCSTALPDREGLRYCPHCGSDQARRRCSSCGDSLEGGWAFCPRCGRETGS